jgi:hypothetical protein
MIRALVLAALLASPALLRGADAVSNFTLETVMIGGAQAAIAQPKVDWNHKVLLLAHGSRPETAPLIADLHPERAALKAMLDDGWIVATTSYRRNGIVVADAISDIDALYDYIDSKVGYIDQAILAEDSVGGLIVTLMAEREPTHYKGAVAFDPTLYIAEKNTGVGLTLLPRIPLLIVATQFESRQSMAYVTALVSRPPPTVPPYLYLINRIGHANINQLERLKAIWALQKWIDEGPQTLDKPAEGQHFPDATVAPDPGPSTAVAHEGGHGFDTKVAEVDAIYGTVLLEAQAPDFAAAGIEPKMFMKLGVQGSTYRVLYGRNYTDVKGGQWIAFPDADGRTALAKLYENAAAAADLKVGDTVSIDLQEK